MLVGELEREAPASMRSIGGGSMSLSPKLFFIQYGIARLSAYRFVACFFSYTSIMRRNIVPKTAQVSYTDTEAELRRHLEVGEDLIYVQPAQGDR